MAGRASEVERTRQVVGRAVKGLATEELLDHAVVLPFVPRVRVQERTSRAFHAWMEGPLATETMPGRPAGTYSLGRL